MEAILNLIPFSTGDEKATQFIKEVYTEAFPPDERREFEKMMAIAESNHKFRIVLIRKGEENIGFISFWHFGNFVYVEHFALHSQKRGGGAGSYTLNALSEYVEAPVVLEVEKPETEQAVRRIDFYLRSGFRLWDNIEYIQPPYSPELNALPLLLMTKGEINLDEQLSKVVTDIYINVYGVGADYKPSL